MARRAAEAIQNGYSNRGTTTGILSPSVATATEITEPQGPNLTPALLTLGQFVTTNGLNNVQSHDENIAAGKTP